MKGKKRIIKKRPLFRKKKVRKNRPTVSKVNLVSSEASLVKLPYFDSYSFTGAYNPAAQVWRTNSLFDPDLTGTGHQPLGFDQYSAFYNNYQVNGFEITLDIRNDTAVSVKGVLCFSDIDSSSATVAVASEYKYSFPFTIGALSANNGIRIKRYMSEAKLHGLKTIQNEESLQAAYTASPSDAGFCWIKFESLDGSTAAKVYAQVRIRYYARLFGALNPAQS